MRRRLVAAIERLRARLNVVIAELEAGDDSTALAELEEIQAEFVEALREAERD